MTKLPWFKFNPNDWLRDTRKLTPVAKAVWIDVLAYCWNEPDRGQYRRSKAAMAREHGITTDEVEDILSELSLSAVADISDFGETVLIVSRRMAKEESAREYERNKKRKQRCPGGVPPVSNDCPPTHSGSVPGEMLDVRSKKLEVREQLRPPKPPLDQGGTNASKPKRERREAKRVEFWQVLVDHINRSWTQRKGTPYPWDAHEFKKLHGLAVIYQTWGVMAMWDLYVQMGTYWGKLTGFMLDGLKKDVGVIVDDPRWKSKCHEYEEKLFPAPTEEMVPTKDLLNSLAGMAKPIH